MVIFPEMYLNLSHPEPHLPQVIRQNENISKSRMCECCECQWTVRYVCYIRWWRDGKKYVEMVYINGKAMWRKERREKLQLEYV